MAGLRGNQAYLVLAKQTGKGVAPTAWEDKYFFSGGSIGPTRSQGQLAETDNTRDAGDYYTEETAVEGNPEVYSRDASLHHILEYVLGSRSKVTTTGNTVHTITGSSAIPYITAGRMIGATLYEQFNDLKVSEVTISAGTHEPLTAALTVMGRSSVRQAAEWAAGMAPPAASSIEPLNFNDATVTLGGGATSLVSSFEVTVANSVKLQATDDSIPFDVVEGVRTVTLGFDMIFENLKEYNKFHYGSESGTTQSSQIFTTTAAFDFAKGANNGATFTFPKIAYQEFPVEPDPGGDPITVSVKAAAQRHASGFVTAEVRNQVEK